MDRIERLKCELAKAVKESREYQEYRKYSDVLDKEPDLRRAVDDFRRENFRYQNSVDIEDPLGASLMLNDRFRETRERDIVNRYLMAEMGMCRLVRGICVSVVRELDFDVDFL